MEQGLPAVNLDDDVKNRNRSLSTLNPILDGATFEATAMPRPEYPRPNFRRDDASWLNLNGLWEFAFDDRAEGCRAAWQNRPHFEGRLNVPFAFQSELSGLGDPSFHDYLWYAREFDLPEGWAGRSNRFVLHFGAVDYACQVWVNGRSVGEHQGGHVPFSFDITDTLKRAEPNRIVVYVEDTQSKFQPRGKQYWHPQSAGCHYTRTSGIWQTVWLEAVPEVYLHGLRVQTDLDREELTLSVEGLGRPLTEEIYWLGVEVEFEGREVWKTQFGLIYEEGQAHLAFTGSLTLPGIKVWSPETPHLYDLRLTLYRGQSALDQVESYFGMRKISTAGTQVLLNNQPYYLRLILDQGYWPGGLLTAPTDDDLRRDIELTKAFGFNGARKHQKIEDPRWLYWADRLGLLVWGEMPSAYEWSQEAERPFITEWLAALVRDYNHPCLMAWVPFNESWGLHDLEADPRQQDFVRRVVALTRDLDRTRLVIDNDGWEHLDGGSDLLTIHDYTAHGPRLIERYTEFGQAAHAAVLPLVSDQARPVFLSPDGYRGEPVIFSEFGGISLRPPERWAGAESEAEAPTETEWGYVLAVAESDGTWGYSNAASTEGFVTQYRGLIEALAHLGFSAGFCYTQLTDVEQEVNGLLTYDRYPKVDPAQIARINLSVDIPTQTEDEQEAVA